MLGDRGTRKWNNDERIERILILLFYTTNLEYFCCKKISYFLTNTILFRSINSNKCLHVLLALVLICMWYRNGFRMLLLLCILSANCRIHFRVTKSKWDYEPSYSGSESSVSPRHCISEKELWVISIPSLYIWNVVFSNETLTPQFLPLVKTISIHCVHFPSAD